MADNSDLIDRVIYTASLVTNAQDIDSSLDTVRMITSRPNANGVLQEGDSQALLSAQHQIEDYLVHREKVRYFTPESLRIQIDQHMAGGASGRSSIQVGIVLALASVAAVLALIVPLASQERISVAIAGAAGMISLGAAWLFLSALRAFTSRLRRAFILICIGVGMMGIGFAQPALIEAYNLSETLYGSTLSSIPFLIMAVVMTWGIREYAQLVDVKSRLLSLKFIIALGIGIPLILGLLTLTEPKDSGTPIAAAVAEVLMFGWLFVLVAMSIFVLPRIIKQVADLYKPSIRALRLAIFSTFAVVIIAGTADLNLGGVELSNTYKLVTYLFVIIMAVLYLRAGYIFNKVSRY